MPRKAFTLVELLVVMTVISVLVALVLSGIALARAAASRVECAHNLRQVGLALHGFHDVDKRFPPLVDGTDGSWLNRLMPFLGQANDTDPATEVQVLQCRLNETGSGVWTDQSGEHLMGLTSYLAVLSEDCPFGRSLARIDDSSGRVMAGERPPSLSWGWWAEGFHHSYQWGEDGNNVEWSVPPEADHFWSRHQGGGNWLYADGSVRFQ